MIAAKQSSSAVNNNIINTSVLDDNHKAANQRYLPPGASMDSHDDDGDNISLKSNYSVISRMSADEQTNYVRQKRADLQDALKNLQLFMAEKTATDIRLEQMMKDKTSHEEQIVHHRTKLEQNIEEIIQDRELNEKKTKESKKKVDHHLEKQRQIMLQQLDLQLQQQKEELQAILDEKHQLNQLKNVCFYIFICFYYDFLQLVVRSSSNGEIVISKQNH